jgi:TRAP-type C4-dicarboxylate transport system substrate-binding protein
MRWLSKSLMGVLGVMVLGVGVANAQPYTLKIGSGTVNDTSQEWLRLFKEGVERNSKGKIKVETYVASQLGSNPRMVEGVTMGTIEGTLPSTGFMVSLEPRFQVFDAVGIFDSPQQSLKVLQDPEIRKRISGFGKEKGVETIAVFSHSPLAVISLKPIRTPADYAGLKLRVPGGSPMHTRPIEKLKASPISMPIMDVLPALQNKGIDGVITGSTVATALKYYDVTKSLTHLPSSMIMVTAVVNSQFMKTIGPELADIVRKEALKAEAPAVKWGVDDAERSKKAWTENGGENIAFSPAAAKQYIDQVNSVTVPVLAQNPTVKADYDALMAAAKKFR